MIYQGQSNAKIVLDTSYLVDLLANMRWALEVRNLISSDKPDVLIPYQVEREYYEILREGNTDNFGVPILYQGLESLLEGMKVSKYNGVLSTILSSKIDEELEIKPQWPVFLSRTDQHVVQTALDYAIEGNQVAVASADYGIVSKIKDIWFRENLDIKMFSPWVPRKTSSLSDLKILISGNVFGELYRADIRDNYQKYLVVARDVHIGGSAYDIAFDVYKSLLEKPRIDGVYFIPVVLFNFDEVKMRDVHYNADILTYKIVATYDSNTPWSITIGINKNPLSLLEKKRLILKVRNRQLTQKDREELFKRLSPEDINWARIEDWHISKFDILSLGELNRLRVILKQRKH